LAEILVTLLSDSANVVVGTTPDTHNSAFTQRISSLAQDARRDDHLSIFVDERNELHTKTIVADDFALVGSMNLTFNGVHLREEYIELRIDQEFVSQARIDAYESFGGVL
jgi:phosphatidylserine/phosphatidylglycerophosphate/cardiolipin synthase-like enzyme